MNRVCSIFSQLLQLFLRIEFQQAVKKHQAERHARGFSCWSQFVAMLFCHLGQAKSLREICNGLMAIEGKLKHLWVEVAANRSTLTRASNGTSNRAAAFIMRVTGINTTEEKRSPQVPAFICK